MRTLVKQEEEAIVAALPAFGAYVAEIGMDRPLADYSKDEVIGLVRKAYVEVRGRFELNDDVPF